MLKLTHGVEHFKSLRQHGPGHEDAKEIFARLHQACDTFLSGVSLDFAGFIPRDPAMRKSVLAQKPLCETQPESPAAKAIDQLADTISQWEVARQLDGNIKFFWKKLLFC